MIQPRMIDFSLWANQLKIDYPNDDIPLSPSVDNWQQWGSQLLRSKSFATSGAPAPSDEKDWEEWAVKVYRIMG